MATSAAAVLDLVADRLSDENPSEPLDAAMQAIARAVDAAHDAYWLACDAEGRAIDPADLDAPDGLLDSAYDDALKVKNIAAADGIPWLEARQFV